MVPARTEISIIRADALSGSEYCRLRLKNIARWRYKEPIIWLWQSPFQEHRWIYVNAYSEPGNSRTSIPGRTRFAVKDSLDRQGEGMYSSSVFRTIQPDLREKLFIFLLFLCKLQSRTQWFSLWCHLLERQWIISIHRENERLKFSFADAKTCEDFYMRFRAWLVMGWIFFQPQNDNASEWSCTSLFCIHYETYHFQLRWIKYKVLTL